MLLNSFIALLAVLAFAFALSALFKIKPAFTPLVSLAVLVDLSVIFALVNMLKAGVAFSYGLAFGLFAFGKIFFANEFFRKEIFSIIIF